MTIPMGRKRAALVVAAVAVAVAGGCGLQAEIRPGDIRRYAVPKESVAEGSVAAGLATRTMDGGKDPAGATPPLRLRYEVPDGWSDRGGTGMRLATLAIGDPAAGREVTVIPAAGTLRSNVERWQGQLGGSADPAARTEAVERAVAEAEQVDVAGVPATVVLLHGPSPADAGDGGEAILGAMIPLDESASLFVKYKGDATVARQERENFIRFVSSIRWK